MKPRIKELKEPVCGTLDNGVRVVITGTCFENPDGYFHGYIDQSDPKIGLPNYLHCSWHRTGESNLNPGYDLKLIEEPWYSLLPAERRSIRPPKARS